MLFRTHIKSTYLLPNHLQRTSLSNPLVCAQNSTKSLKESKNYFDLYPVSINEAVGAQPTSLVRLLDMQAVTIEFKVVWDLFESGGGFAAFRGYNNLTGF